MCNRLNIKLFNIYFLLLLKSYSPIQMWDMQQTDWQTIKYINFQMSHPPPSKKKELNIKHQTQMMEDSFHHMFFLFLKKSIYAGATQNITFLIICCTHWYIKHVIKNNMHLKHSNNNNSTSNIQCLIKHTMLLEK